MTLFKLGVSNVKHNFGKYLSYFISTVFSVFMLFLFFSIYFNKQIQAFSGGKVKVDTAFKAASIIVIIFSALFIWYANSFFIKSRKKEMALYSILGMKKKEIGTLLFSENIFLGLFSIILGLPLGIIVSRFILQLLVNMMKSNVNIKFTLEPNAVIATILIFAVVFIFNSIRSSKVVYKYSLIELLSAEKECEVSTEGSKGMALISILMIFVGYVIAYTKTLQGGSQMVYFGLLVLVLVVTGTYILFNNLIVILLKRLKKNKKLYYKGENLVSISQILYRIKANSNVLATIAIVSAVAITALGFTFSLYMSLEKQTALAAPYSLMYKAGNKELDTKIYDVINKHKEVKITHRSNISIVEASGLTNKYKGPNGKDLKVPFGVKIISESEYNEILRYSELNKSADSLKMVKKLKLNKDNDCFFIEVSTTDKKGFLKGENVKIESSKARGEAFNLNIVDSDVNGVLGYNLGGTTVVVTDKAFKRLTNNNAYSSILIRGYSLNDSLKSEKLVSELNKIIPNEAYFDSYFSEHVSEYRLMGSYVFIGMFLGILFVLSTGSILYYKQLIEAFADRERYRILRKIGTKKKETKHIISKQLALIFGMPLIISLLHSSVALAAYIVKLMGASKLVVESTLAITAGYIIVYLFYYVISVSSYTKIVSSNN
ncbi:MULTISPECIES: FtsX-like permease family protein [Clostridium]|uniref:FtsX-like permease family protein n=1 Tax=Clostridium TaxID=1485 RepID=UPI0008243BCE|nr:MULTISPECIES: ABC transporter permease [Clostridium]PJI06985.1 ABC transporter permease [Clostridium sp. CT7]